MTRIFYASFLVLFVVFHTQGQQRDLENMLQYPVGCDGSIRFHHSESQLDSASFVRYSLNAPSGDWHYKIKYNKKNVVETIYKYDHSNYFANPVEYIDSFMYNNKGKVIQTYTFRRNAPDEKWFVEAITDYIYNSQNLLERRVKRFRINDFDPAVSERTTYTYSNLGQLLTMRNYPLNGLLNNFTTFHYDPESRRLLEQKHYISSPGFFPFSFQEGYFMEEAIGYGYNSDGKIIAERHRMGTVSYDETPTAQLEHRLDYNQVALEESMFIINGEDDELFSQKKVYEHNNYGQCTAFQHEVQGDEWGVVMSYQAHYKTVAKVEAVNDKDKVNARVIPNPITDNCVVFFNSDQSQGTTISVYSWQGLRVKTMHCVANEGDNQWTLDLSDVSQGNYIILIETEKGIKKSLKVAKQ